MGTRRRQLFSYRGLYFHLQDFDDDNGGERDRGGQDRPAVRQGSARTCKPFIEAYDPATWRSPADAMATRFYTGRRSAVTAATRGHHRHRRGRARRRRHQGVLEPAQRRAAPPPAAITFFDPSPLPLPGRRRDRLRPRGARPDPAGDPAHGPGRAVRRRRGPRGASPTAASTWPALDPHRIGVTIGSAVGATMGLDERVPRRQRRRPAATWSTTTYAVPHLYNYLVPSSFAAEVAWAVGAEGPARVVSTGCTSGLDAVGYARRADPGGRRRRR